MSRKPTYEELQALLAQKLPYPETSVFTEKSGVRVYETTLREWSMDSGTYVDKKYRFEHSDRRTVLLRALIIALDGGKAVNVSGRR